MSETNSTTASSQRNSITEDIDIQFRVKKIEILMSDCIKQIKFIYDDDTFWCIGKDEGKSTRPLILTQGEYIIKVKHEKFFNNKYAGAAIHFETNKGRNISYVPNISTQRCQDQTIIQADEGKEIISLKIDKGTLQGIKQQDVPKNENILHPKEWYTVIQTNQKENQNEDYKFQIFNKKQDALDNFNQLSNEIKQKKGRAILIVDSIKNIKIQSKGDKLTIQNCIDYAKENGVFVETAENEKSIIDTIILLFKILSQKKDIYNFFITMLFITSSYYFDLTSSLLAGSVLTSFGIGEVNNNLEDDHFMTKTICQNFFQCELVNDYRKAILICFIIVKILQSFLYVANVYIHHNACDSKNSDLKNNCFKHVLSLDYSFFETKNMSDIRSSMNVNALNNTITWNVPYIISKSLKLIMIFYFMFSISLKLTMICTIFMFILKFGLLDSIGKYEQIAHKISRKLENMNSQIFDETLDMINCVKMFNKEEYHQKQYYDSQLKYKNHINAVVIYRCIREFLYGILKVLTFGTVMYYCIQELTEQSVTSANITSFYLLFEQVQDIIGALKWHYEFLLRDHNDIEKFLILMKTESKIKSGSIRPDNFEGKITFNDVKFEYPSRPGQEVLKGLSMNIEPYKMTAIVGESGAGKSTITNLAMRMYDCKSGNINIDGIYLKDIDLKYYHEQIAIVNQNPNLFDCSIRDNIKYGAHRDVSDEEIIQAAKLANCYDFIMKFRSGFDTFAGSKGAQLSGGQKQRIAIARAAISNPKILILDEATSALDSQNEKVVQQAIERIMIGKTVLVVAHRLSTIKNADEIICMKEGKVVEKGTHNDLMEKKGNYFNLIQKQLS